IEERSEIGSKDICLYVSRVEVICGVENLEPSPQRMFPPEDNNLEGPYYLKVERGKSRVTLAVAPANKIQLIVHHRVGEASVNIKHWPEFQLPGEPQRTPEQEPVRCIERQGAKLICTNDGVWKVAEELFKRVQVAVSVGVNETGVQRRAF